MKFLLCGCDFVGDFAVAIEELNNRHAIGFKSGDVLIEYGGQKIDNADDFYRLRYAHYEGEKVAATVKRGQEKITKDVTLEAMK